MLPPYYTRICKWCVYYSLLFFVIPNFLESVFTFISMLINDFVNQITLIEFTYDFRRIIFEPPLIYSCTASFLEILFIPYVFVFWQFICSVEIPMFIVSLFRDLSSRCILVWPCSHSKRVTKPGASTSQTIIDI